MKKFFKKKGKAKINKKKYIPNITKSKKNKDICDKENFILIKNNIEELDKKTLHNSIFDKIDKLTENLNAMSLIEKILRETKKNNLKNLEEKNKELNKNNEIKKGLSKENIDGKGEKFKDIDISNDVKIMEDSIKNNTPYKILYLGSEYTYEGKNPIKRKKITYHCKNYRKIKNLPANMNKFCNSTIQGIRNDTNKAITTFILKKKHSTLCQSYLNYNKNKNSNKNLSEIKNFNLDLIIMTKGDFNEHLDNYIKTNKHVASNYREFLNYAKKLYIEKKLKNIFTCDIQYLKNLYYRTISKYYQLNLENIYDYSEKISNNEYFCRYVAIKQLISKDNKIITHKAVIFFTDFDIRRLAFSKHLLIDGTFVFPKGFLQTIIIMYYDEILDKMIPGVFIVINNKTQVGYVDVFKYLKYYIENLLKNRTEKYKFETFTTDFEIGLYEAFNKVFNTNNKIRHLGCYFHFLQNIRKYFQKKGLTKKKYENVYNNLINTCRNLPFNKYKNENLINKVKNNYEVIMKYKDDKIDIEEKKTILMEFVTYFEGQWLDYFNKGVLDLNHINIKYRSNNCLENFNKQLKRINLKKKDIILITYVDNLIDEVIDHENYIVEETKKPLKKISKKSELNLGENEIVANFDKIIIDISNEILDYDYEIYGEEGNIEEDNSNFFEPTKEENVPKKINKKISSVKKLFYDIYQNFHSLEEVLFHSLIGLNNLDNTCYLNSGLQIIFHCYRFMLDLLFDINKNMNSNLINSDTISNKLIELIRIMVKKFIKYKKINNMKDLYKNLDFKNNNIISDNLDTITVEPIEFFETFSKLHPIYNTGQHDCVEFLRVILNDLSKENMLNKEVAPYKEIQFKDMSKKEGSEEYHKYYISRENSSVIKNFYFQIINTFVCTCGFRTYSYEKFLDLPILIPGNENIYNLTDLLHNYFCNTLITWSTKCDRCKENNLNHIKFPRFDMVGNYLIISIQRIDRILNIKNVSYIIFEDSLNIKNFFDSDSNEDNMNFSLIGGIYHQGTMEFGHYYSIIKIQDNWVEFNDNYITKVKNMEFSSNSICALIYEKSLK